MRIKSDVEFVKRACMSDDTIAWSDRMKYRCGSAVTEVTKISDNKVECTFSDGAWYYYTPACLEESVILEKGKMYTVNGSTDSFEFLEESENFVIFEGGIVFKKEGNTFTGYDPKPEFLKKEWRVEKLKDDFVVYCGGFGICTIGERGLYPNKNISSSLGLPLDENGAVKIENS
jgi:hypothetical protein